MERLFDLDFQLLHDAVITAVAVFVLFLFLSYMLFKPARELLKKRQERMALFLVRRRVCSFFPFAGCIPRPQGKRAEVGAGVYYERFCPQFLHEQRVDNVPKGLRKKPGASVRTLCSRRVRRAWD